MIVFDTYAWIEFFIGSAKGKAAAEYVYGSEEIAVSSLCLAEIFVKYDKEDRPAESRLDLIRSRCVVVDVSSEIALLAAKLKLEHSLYLADAVMYATAIHLNSRLLTGDKHFSKMEHIEFLS